MAKQRRVEISGIWIGAGEPLALIAGPCVIESRDLCLRIAESVKAAAAKAGVPYIFKASYDKANRTSAKSFRGPGREKGLRILEDVRREIGVPILSDVHTPEDCAAAGKVLDALQIPAFLCRQTDLITAAAATGRPVNVKKGQFMSPDEMANVCAKAKAAGNERVLLTERGTFFGYHRLVNDMQSIPRMQALGCPVIFDGTHSTQAPGGAGDKTGGFREMAAPLSLAAVAAGADGLFLETHPEPDKGLSDAATMLPLSALPDLLRKAAAIREIVKG